MLLAGKLHQHVQIERSIMTNTDYKDTNTSWFTENWEEIRKELIKDVEKVNKLKKEVMKIYQEQISFSAQISAAVV